MPALLLFSAFRAFFFRPLAACLRALVPLAQTQFVLTVALAQNPLNLPPGIPATVTLGQIQTLANFNTSLGSAEISYSNPDLSNRQYVVRLPSGFDPANPAKRYGLVTWIDAGDAQVFPAAYAAPLDAHDVIWLGGLSGGGRTASNLAYLRSDYFAGLVGRVGSSIAGIIPGWESAGTNSTNSDANYEIGSGSSIVLPPSLRTAILTQYGDFRRAENLAIYRWGHLNPGQQAAPATLTVNASSHSDTVTGTIDLPTANPPRRFLRLRVTSP